MNANRLSKAQAIVFWAGLLAGGFGLAAKTNMVVEAQGSFIDFGYFWSHINEANSQSLIYWLCNLVFMAGLVFAMLLEYWKRKQS